MLILCSYEWHDQFLQSCAYIDIIKNINQVPNENKKIVNYGNAFIIHFRSFIFSFGL
jgi:hypothetical protein